MDKQRWEMANLQISHVPEIIINMYVCEGEGDILKLKGGGEG